MTKTTIPTLITAGLGGHAPVQPAVTTNCSFSSIARQQVQPVGGDVVENQTLCKETIKLANPTVRGKRLWRTSKDQGYSDECYTPKELVESLGRFDVDPCAARLSGVNLAKRNIRLPKNGLTANWKGRVWLAPPYSQVGVWLNKLIQHNNGVALVNGWTAAGWMHTAIPCASAVMFLRNRVRFYRVEKDEWAEFCIGQMLIAFGEQNADALANCGQSGVFVHGPFHKGTTCVDLIGAIV